MTQDYWENLYQMVSNRYVVVVAAAAAAAAAAVIVSDHFSGPGRALGLLCASVCVCPDNIFQTKWPLSCQFMYLHTTLVKFIGRDHRSEFDVVG